MTSPSEQLFLFVQCELPWTLGPADGRYLLRSALDGEPERVIVLKTLTGRRAAEPARALGTPGLFARRTARRRRREVPPASEPEPVPIARVTIVDPVSVSAERQARAWLTALDPEREIPAAFAALNRLLYCYRIAAADPYAHAVTPAQAPTIRAGWGTGEQVADGEWLFAQELPYAYSDTDLAGAPGDHAPGEVGAPRETRAPRDIAGMPGNASPPDNADAPENADASAGSGPGGASAARGARRRRSPRARIAALRPDEHLAQLLGARERPLLCEELVLRARLDLDQGRAALAAIDLDSALAAATRELAEQQSVDLSERVAELQIVHADIERMARAALSGPGAPDVPPLRHALERLEAALRARGAAGYDATPQG